VDYLTLPWWVYEQGAMRIGTLRVWLGTLELVEKRCGAAADAPVHYSAAELRRLLRVPRLAPVTDAVQQLEDLGLLAWSSQAIGLLPHAEVVQEALAQDGYHTLRAQCAPERHWVPVPRRLLVWLAQEGQAGLIATALGVLLRCMRYKARQCVAGGRVAAPWIAAVFGVAERTVQRAMQTLQRCGWLARVPVQPGHERTHGRYTVINLAWQRPGATDRARRGREADASPEKPAPASCHNMSPLQGGACQKMSPMAAQTVSIMSENRETCADAHAALFQPFQEERPDPEPTGRGSAGASTRTAQDAAERSATSTTLPEDEGVTEDAYTAAAARLVAQGTDPAWLIRPVVLAEVQRARQEASRSPGAAPVQAPEVPDAPERLREPVAPCPGPATCPVTPQTPQAPTATPPACARPPAPLPPPTLRDVTLVDLGDAGRLLALHQQAMARGWLRGGEAAQLNVVAAAVHARRVGQDPCRLFVALLRDQRWEVITQEDEDQARRLLRAHRDGPCRRPATCAAAPEVPLPDDTRFVLLAEQVLRQAGWQGDPFLAVQMQYPMWTRARWEQARAELTQWRLQQVQARQQGSLDTMAIPWEDTEAEDG
jgi:hypothetical protein